STQLLGAEHLTTLTAMIFRFRVQDGAGDLVGSFATLQSAYDTALRFAKPEWLNTQFVTLSYAGALVDRNRADEAGPILRRFLDQNAQGLHGARASENRTLAETLLAKGASPAVGPDAVIASLQAVVERARQAPGSNPYALTYAETTLGDLLVEASRLDEAKAAYESALAHAATVPGQAEELGSSVRSRIAFVSTLAQPNDAWIEALRRSGAELRARVGEHSPEGLASTVREAVAMLRAGYRQDACATAMPVALRLREGFGEGAPETRKALRVVRACG
ncbi:MAG TPA: hypothetical protein VJM11_11590, partial [Nevskiaceae bacterium]|nr:hypothetical protein [Nevskiaceae bacterium]